MTDFINTDVFLSRVLYFIKLAIFANKGTKDEETLNSCVALYNKIKRIDLKEERDEADENIIRRFIKILNMSLKVDETGQPVNIANKELQSRMLHLQSLEPIRTQSLGDMRRFLKETNVTLFYGIRLSFFLKKCKHEEISWHYLLLCYHITQILAAELSTDSHAKHVIEESTNILEQTLIRLSSLERKIEVNKLMSKDVYLRNNLAKADNREMIQQSTEEVKRILAGRGISEDSVLFKLVDKIGDKLEDLDQDGANIFNKLGSLVGEIGLEMRGQMSSGDDDDDEEERRNDIKTQLASVMEIFKEVTSDSKEMEKMPKEARDMVSKIMTVIPTDPNEKISADQAKEFQDLLGKDVSDITKNMARTMGADPLEVKEVEEMIKNATPQQLNKALKFKL